MFLHRLAPDLVHIPLNRVPLLMMRPYVVTVHDMSSLLFDQPSGLRMQLRRYRFRRGLAQGAPCDRRLRRHPPRCAESDGHSAEIASAASTTRLTRASTISPATAPRSTRRILERYQIQYPFLLYAGNIRRHKNVPRLVEAFAVLRAQLGDHPKYRDLRLVIIGDTISQYPGVRQAVIKSRMEHLVRFLGFVPFDTLRCFYESAAAFVFPSRYEGFGLPPLEAMACGTPVVTSNVSSLPEVVGDAAILVNPENVFDIARGIREALLDEPLRAELIRRGRAQAARFSWERTARAVLEIYMESARG